MMSGSVLRTEEPPLMMPASESDLTEAVGDAVSASHRLDISGNGSKRGYGAPVEADRRLSTAGLTGITLYEPSEMVISARAGTPLAELSAALENEGQMLAFEPADLRHIYGHDTEPTVGGLAATNLSGPRRILNGACRDAVLGVRMVTGRAEVIISGGRVMKNVTGYDLVKLAVGSFGTLGILSEVTLKVLPVPETETTLVLEGLSDETGVQALSEALKSPFEVSGAAHLPAFGGEPARTLVRLEGFEASIRYRADRLAGSLGEFGAVEKRDEDISRAEWKAVRDCTRFSAGENGARPLWRISVKPGDGPAVAAAIRSNVPSDCLYDWGGGLIWLQTGDSEDFSDADHIRSALLSFGGHATLVRGSDTHRQSVPVFQPQTAAISMLSEKIRSEFDPSGILNPGRFTGEG